MVGLGRIGSEVARKCQAMGMNVIAYRSLTSIPTRIFRADSIWSILKRLFEQADFITVHVPLTDATRNLINKDTIARMKDGVRLLNCARGGIINENDLYDALEKRQSWRARHSMFSRVEPNTESPLLELDNFIATPHLGASTVEAQRKVSEDICRQVSDYLLKNTVDGALNFPRLEAGAGGALSAFCRSGGASGDFYCTDLRWPHADGFDPLFGRSLRHEPELPDFRHRSQPARRPFCGKASTWSTRCTSQSSAESRFKRPACRRRRILQTSSSSN